MIIDYGDDKTNQVINVTQGVVVPEADGTLTLSNFKIKNLSPLCRQFRLKGNGIFLKFRGRDWAMIMPYQELNIPKISGLLPDKNLEIITNRQGDFPGAAFVTGLCNVAAVVFATGTGDHYKPESANVDLLYAFMDAVDEAAGAVGAPLVQVEAIMADFMGGRRWDGIVKLVKFNAEHPQVLPILLKDWFQWSVDQGWVAKFVGKLVEVLDLGKKALAGGTVLWAMAFEQPLEAHVIISARQNALSQHPTATSAKSPNELALRAPAAYGVDWAARESGGQIVGTSSQIALEEQYQLIDARYSTNWSAPIAGNAYPYTTLDLAGSRPIDIDTIRILACSTDGCNSNAALKGFQVEVSNDSIYYYPVYSGEIAPDQLYAPVEISLNGTLAQYVRVIADSAQDGTSPTVSLAEIEVYGTPTTPGDAFEPDGAPEYAQEIVPFAGGSKGHTFHYPGDTDWFRFSAVSGVTYIIETSNLGPTADTVLYLLNSDQTEIVAWNDDSGDQSSSRLEWTPVTDGVYYLALFNFISNRSGATSTYDLHIRAKDRTVYLPSVLSAYNSISSPSAPSYLKATALSANRILVEWKDNSDNELGFTIYRGGDVYMYTAPDVNSLIITGLSPSSYQCFSVAAFNQQAYSSWTDWSCTTSLDQSGIFGRVKWMGQSAAGINVELRSYDGNTDNHIATATTNQEGVYIFSDVPSLNPSQYYYVRYLNGSNGNSVDLKNLWLWNTSSLSDYTTGQNAQGGDFDIGDVPLKYPSGDGVGLPAEFRWVQRSTAASESYELDILKDNYYVFWEVSNHKSGYTLWNVPTGLTYGTPYQWEVWVYDGSGGYGISLGLFAFTLGAQGIAAVPQHQLDVSQVFKRTTIDSARRDAAAVERLLTKRGLMPKQPPIKP